jgi:hypothetical protein
VQEDVRVLVRVRGEDIVHLGVDIVGFLYLRRVRAKFSIGKVFN